MVARSAAASTGATELYVAPGGNDAGDGSFARPFATLARAQAAVQALAPAMAGDIVVNVHGGTYQMTNPLSLTAADSGVNGHRIIYQAYGYGTPQQENVDISGGRSVTGWALSDATKNIWKVDVGGLETRQLYVNGQRAPRASIPNTMSLTETPTGYVDQSLSSANWVDPTDIEAVWTRTEANWSEPRCDIASIVGSVITMDQPCFSRVLETNIAGTRDGRAPTAFENSLSFLTQPGTFVLDTSQAGHHMLYYIPRSGENLSQSSVVAPRLATLVDATGSATVPVHDVTFQGFDFTDATWLGPNTTAGFPHYLSELFENGDATIYGATTSNQLRTVPGNLRFLFSDRITLEGNRFHRLGGAGLEIAGSGNTVRGNVFTDISSGGVVVGDAEPATTDAISKDNIIDDNWIHDIGVEYHGGTGVTALGTTDIVISHNQINSLGDRGIFVQSYRCNNDTTSGGATPRLPVCQGGPTIGPEHSQGAQVLNNLIFDVMKTIGDGGGIYTVASQGDSFDTGTVVRGNVVHDTDSLTQVVGGVLGAPVDLGLYTDYASQWVTMEANVVYNVQHSAGGFSVPGTGQIQNLLYLRNFWVDDNPWWPGGPPLNVTAEGNTTLPRENTEAACSSVPACAQILQQAGLDANHQYLLNS